MALDPDPAAYSAENSTELPPFIPGCFLSVAVPPGAVILEGFAFAYRNDMRAVTVPPSVTEMGPETFAECSQLVLVRIAAQITELPTKMCLQCERLTEVVLPEGLVTIGEEAFSSCVSLRSVALPSTLEVIGRAAFCRCCNLRSIALPPSLKVISSGAFYEAGLVWVDVPERATTVGTMAFFKCAWMLVAEVRNPTAMILDNAFSDCLRLQYAIAPAVLPHTERCFGSSTPAPALGGVVGNTAQARRQAAAFKAWSRVTHKLCRPTARQWVIHLLLAAGRLSCRDMHLPFEMWAAILRCIPLDVLGTETHFKMGSAHPQQRVF